MVLPDAVQPLRINKMVNTTSPSKLPRPLGEIGVTEKRRNSPSFNQTNRTILSPEINKPETSPSRSPKALWNRDGLIQNFFNQENSPDADLPPPSKRSSIENLKRASRVANSPMFARETRDKYDPSSSPILERPLTDRISPRIQQNPFTKFDFQQKENVAPPSPGRLVNRRMENLTDNIIPAAAMSPPRPFVLTKTSQEATSPQKPSLVARLLPTTVTHDVVTPLTDDSRAKSPGTLGPQLRPVKSVTFQSAPPEIKEYEQQTPEPSLAASDRDGSYESDDFEEGSFERNSSAELEDDSFDESLEDTAKTPVVLPGDWKNTSPDNARTQLVDDEDDVFETGSPAPTTRPITLQPYKESDRSESMNSESSNRPLPPLPNQPINDQSAMLQSRLQSLALKESSDTIVAHDVEKSRRISDLQDLPEFEHAPQISRESIMKKVRADLQPHQEEDGDTVERESLYSEGDIDYSELARLDPDVAIPSRENSTQFDGDKKTIDQDQDGSVLDLEHMVDLSYNPAVLAEFGSPYPSGSRRSSVVYNKEADNLDVAGLGIDKEAYSTPLEEPIKQRARQESGLPFLSGMLGKSDFDLGLKDYMAFDKFSNAQNPPTGLSKSTSILPLAAELRSSLSSAEEDTGSDGRSSLERDIQAMSIEEVTIPERKATIKTGGRLKARPSGTPADFQAMVQNDADLDEHPVPNLPMAFRNASGSHSEAGSFWSNPSGTGSNESKNDSAVGGARELKLDLGQSSSEAELGSSFSLSKEMERLMDAQQKGYVTRENAKVVVASTRNFSQSSSQTAMSTESDTSQASTAKGIPVNQNRKISGGERFIQTEPWNGKMRRKSNRRPSIPRSNSTMAPPMPGHESALDTLEEQSFMSDDDNAETERGRLFVKVAGIRELQMPLPRNERVHFQLTLDNGLHCVTTANLDLAENATVGQEFELVVQQDLDFQLTLTTTLPPPPRAVDAFTQMPYKSPRSPTKSVFSRLLSSPKKRAEQERKAQQEAEAEERRRGEEAERQRIAQRPTSWDKMRELVDAQTGSFARAYVGLKAFEEECYGRQLTTLIPLYNEWAEERDEQVVSSVRSKRSNGFGIGSRNGIVRRPPFQIGSLEVQLLYVPRAKNFSDDDMPKSMSAAIKEMKEADRIRSVKHEGFLSQQGGDCPYWRRRFFRLAATKLTAYHEHTMQPRATINLAKAARLIDDKTSLIADPVSASPEKAGKSGKKRRKSAFAEEDEGYQFVEEGFRLRFNNGETIDFYALNAEEKDKWMEVLSEAMRSSSTSYGSSSKKLKWTDLILSQEASMAAKSSSTTMSSPTKSLSNTRPVSNNVQINVCPPSSSSMNIIEQHAPFSPTAESTYSTHHWTGNNPAPISSSPVKDMNSSSQPMIVNRKSVPQPPAIPSSTTENKHKSLDFGILSNKSSGVSYAAMRNDEHVDDTINDEEIENELVYNMIQSDGRRQHHHQQQVREEKGVANKEDLWFGMKSDVTPPLSPKKSTGLEKVERMEKSVKGAARRAIKSMIM